MGSGSPHLAADAPWVRRLTFQRTPAAKVPGSAETADRQTAGLVGKAGVFRRRRGPRQQFRRKNTRQERPKILKEKTRRQSGDGNPSTRRIQSRERNSPAVMTAQTATTHRGLFGVVTKPGFYLGPKPRYPLRTLAQQSRDLLLPGSLLRPAKGAQQ